MKVKARKTIYYHDKDRKLVMLRPGQVADVPAEIVKNNPLAFEDAGSGSKKGESKGGK